jgi:hypothetical protein
MDVRFEIPLGLGIRLAESGSYICPDSRAQLGFGDRRDRIGTYRSRDYECLGVMDGKWGETVFRFLREVIVMAVEMARDLLIGLP